MISFQSRKPEIRFADTIARKAHSIYPHVSSSKIIANNYIKSNNSKNSTFLGFGLLNKINNKMAQMRSKLDFSPNYYYTLIHEIKKYRVANCYEEATLAKLIGSVNGIKNIYVGDLILKDKVSGSEQPFDHSIAFITDKKLDKDGVFRFKNKDAILIDPWLKFADFASNYFTKIKNSYNRFFPKINDQSKEIATEINDKHFEIIIKPSNHNHREIIDDLEKMYPELLIKK